ncbi:TOPRS ligase, partial [Todus mexicanus]|nr:TOPRS ligase [Todus mexicanus]
MDTETEWSCPICHNARDDIAYVMPCCHQFCLSCTLRWASMRQQCPLCRGPIDIVRFPLLEAQNYLQFVLTGSERSPGARRQARRAPSHPAESSPHRPVASSPLSPQAILSSAEQEAVGGLLPQVWAELFQRQERLLDPLLSWLRRALEAIYGTQWWRVRSAEGNILHALCVCGLDEEVMVQRLQDCLEEYTSPLVHGVINTIVQRCSEDAQRLHHSRAATEEDNSPADSSSSSSPVRSSSSSSSSFSSSSTSSISSRGGTPDPILASSSSSSGSPRQAEAGRTEATPGRDPGCPRSVPSPAEQERPQEEPVEAAGPSAQGWSRRPSVSDQGRGRLLRGPRRPPKRRTASSEDCPQPCKRSHCRQH